MARGINPLGPIGGAALLSACAHAIPLQATLERPPTVRQVPLAVGVFYSQEFRDYMHSNWRGGDRWDFPLGQASVKLFGQALPILFESVVPVSGRSPLPEGGAKLAAVIEPKIEAFDFSLPSLQTGTYTAEISYRVTLHSPEDLALASWTVKGIGAKPGLAVYGGCRSDHGRRPRAGRTRSSQAERESWRRPALRG